MHSKLLPVALALAVANAAAVSAAYTLKDDYQPENFFDGFNFFDDDDPTWGYVNYLERTVAQDQGLISTDNGSVFMGVDAKAVASGRGRSSVRIETKESYDGGLIAIDVAHMPGGICGTWPAFWSVGPNWPNDGELDIIEGINSRDYNVMAVHTMDGCVVERSDYYKDSSVLETDNCYINAPGQGDNQGCAFNDHAPNNFGKPFNEIGGGVYATEWTSDVVNVWFFSRGDIPEDLNGPSPDPTAWGKPNAQFKGTCDFTKLLKEQRFIFNTALCGGWTESQWDTDPVCSKKAPTCKEFVRDNPEAFEEAYWEINYMKVFQEGLPPTEPTSEPEKTSTEVEPEPTKTAPSSSNSSPTSSPTEDDEDKPTKPTTPTEDDEDKPTKPTTPAEDDEDKPPKPTTPAEDEDKPSCTAKPTPSCTTYVTTITETFIRTLPISEVDGPAPTPEDDAAKRHMREHRATRRH